ncbi:UNKNOWN [Stylonychia lemnae]|uniref:C2H2-type domain-containing protein n=1 Tax=Stylonychia lemnae TaxID=5949 RepID=A0A078A6M5_STYLE|nr:UNKNOWN [Stylonychia lemnae]|eukprot:CDW77247.1 UNKNOWN [Stylonychia lemnae]
MNNSPSMKYDDLQQENQSQTPMSKPMPAHLRKLKPKLSLDDMDLFESRKVIDSPMSIKACKMEGILPKELLYKPMEDYLKSCKDPQMAELKYKINEAKRQNSPISAYKHNNVNIFKKALYRNQQKHQSSQNLKHINQGGFAQTIHPHSTSNTGYLKQYAESGQASPMINSRYLSSRFSTRASMTSARKFLRQYSKSDKIVDNALVTHNQALEQKISSVNLDFSKDVSKFKDLVKMEQLRLQRNKSFNNQLARYNTMKEQFMATLERKLKEKSDQIIDEKIQKEMQTLQHISKEKNRFKKEVIHRENLQLNIENQTQQKFQRIQSAKLLNHMKRLEVYKKAEDDLGQNISYLQNKVQFKEQRLNQQMSRIDQEREIWKQQFIRMKEQHEQAQKRLESIEKEKFSPEVKSQNLMRLYSDIKEKEQKWKENREKQIYRLNSAQQDFLKKNYIDKITKQKEDQVRRKQTVFQIKKQIAESNKKHQERQKNYEAQEISLKIQDHQKAHQNYSHLKNGIEMKRIKFQFDLEKRKQEIRETLFRMQIWNVWDERVLELVFQRPKGTSIDAVVREFAANNPSKQMPRGEQQQKLLSYGLLVSDRKLRKTLLMQENIKRTPKNSHCSQCQQTFAQYSSLQKHQRVHDKRKPYVCKFDGCNQAFSQISNLIRHERIHTGEKPYICNFCKKKFASGSNLKQHVQVHDNDDTRIQYKCYVDGCGKGYLYISSLKKHIQVSHPVNYETEIKTNKCKIVSNIKSLLVDLNNCKEIIQDIDNHQYHDDEEDKEQEEMNILLGKRKNHNDKVVQQVPQRRKLKLNNNNQTDQQYSQPTEQQSHLANHQQQTQTMQQIQKSNIQAIMDRHLMVKNQMNHESTYNNSNNLTQLNQKQSEDQQKQLLNGKQLIQSLQIGREQLDDEDQNSNSMRSVNKKLDESRNIQSLQQSKDIQQPKQAGIEHQKKPIIQFQKQNQISQNPTQFELKNNQFQPMKVQPIIRTPIPQSTADYMPSLLMQKQQQSFLLNRLPQLNGIQQMNTNNTQKVFENNLKQNLVQQSPIKQSFQPFNQYLPNVQNQSNNSQTQSQSELPQDLLQEMQSVQMKLQSLAPDYYNQVSKLVNDYGMIVSALTLHLTQNNQSKDAQQQIQSQQLEIKLEQSQDMTDNQDQNQQNKEIMEDQQQQESQNEEADIPLITDAENITIGNISLNRLEIQRDPKIEAIIINEEKNLLSINVQDTSKTDNSVDSNGQIQKRFKYQSVPLNLKKKQRQQEIFQKNYLQSDNIVDDTNNTFRTSRSNSFSNPEQEKNISDYYQSMLKGGNNSNEQNQLNLSQESNQIESTSKKSQKHIKSKTAYYDDSLFQSQQASKINEREQSGCGGDSGGCCGGGCGSNSQKQNFESPKKEVLQQQVKVSAQEDSCCQSKPRDQACCSKQQSCGDQDLMGEDEEAEMIKEMNNAGMDGSEFKQPYPIQKKVQSSFLNKNKDQTLMLFSKLPCIKTCMTKVSFSDEKHPSSNAQCKGNKAIEFESVEDDFVIQSISQLGTASCKHLCDAQKLCPEILPTNCDDYFNKKCNCTVYCKKTLKFIQKFVKDEAQVAEIEDLCNIQDQISLMVSQGSKC